MKIYFKEIAENETEFDFTESQPWVSAAVDRLDERDESRASAPKARATVRSVTLHFDLRKVDEVVVVNGKIKTDVQLLCSRCANSFTLHADLSFSTLFCKDAAMAGIAHLDADTPMGRTSGHARHEHDANGGSGSLDITYVAEEYIDLADVLTEQLRLQIPFQPLCKEDCKGICASCGADWNTGRCACAKLQKKTPFSVLENFKGVLKKS